MTAPGHRGGAVRVTAAAAVAAGLGACAGTVPYAEPGAPNLQFRAASSGNLLTYTAIDLDIHRVSADCRAEYAGSHALWTPLGPTTDPVHLPEDRLSLLSFTFHGHGATEVWTSYRTLVRPRAGRTYEAAVSYGAGYYQVEIRERGPGGEPGRVLEHRSLADCGRV